MKLNCFSKRSQWVAFGGGFAAMAAWSLWRKKKNKAREFRDLFERYDDGLKDLTGLSRFYSEWENAEYELAEVSVDEQTKFSISMAVIEDFLCDENRCSADGGEALTHALTLAMGSYNSAKGASNGLATPMAKTLMPALHIPIRASFERASSEATSSVAEVKEAVESVISILIREDEAEVQAGA